jgi:uncharacterized repeat protein (TIGR03806 family)
VKEKITNLQLFLPVRQAGIINSVWIVLLLSCSKPQPETIVVKEEELPSLDLTGIGLPKLSDYGFFRAPINKLIPTDSLVPYILNSALFSDYAFKKRFIKIPKGKSAAFHASEVMDFPEGTILIKNFYYPADFSKPEEQWRILETRLLINEKQGWKPITYIWNDEQTEAFLDVAGKTVTASWMHNDGVKRNIRYSIPNQNQCKSCHMKDGMVKPIGPTARQLNRDMENGKLNQLENLKALGKLTGLPDLSTVERLADYSNSTFSIDSRARAWLEVNCAHCHRPEGPAKTSGLHLLASVTNQLELGIGKAPVAAGKGSGGLQFDIVPGQPEKSILFFRVKSTDPGIMMPELGRSIAHDEGVDLIRQWIAEMK